MRLVAEPPVGEQGVVCFVSNGAYIDATSADGLRKALAEECSAIWCLNLRGGIRGRAGDQAKKEGGNPFDIMTPVAITLLVKDLRRDGPAEIHYHDIGDYLTREDKLAALTGFSDVARVSWQQVTPNSVGDWINQRGELYVTFPPLGDKTERDADALFTTYSNGVKSNRDAWSYNFSRRAVLENMAATIGVYNAERARFGAAVRRGDARANDEEVSGFVDPDPRRISWTVNLKADLRKDKPASSDPTKAVASLYRPFCKQWLYFDRQWNERGLRIPSLFPAPEHGNRVIAVSGVGAGTGYSVLMADVIPCLHLAGAGNAVQCFPRYHYVTANEEDSLFTGSGYGGGAASGSGSSDGSGYGTGYGYERHDAISSCTLDRYRKRFGANVSADDVFHCVYGLLHSPEYRSRFAAELGKMIPRLPMVDAFAEFVADGQRLAELHVGYEQVEPWPVDGLPDKGASARQLHVDQLRFTGRGRDGDRSTIVVNDVVALSGIPEEAHRYQVNGRSALEWLIYRYRVKVDKDSGLVNDPNAWGDEHGDPRYIIDLIARIVRVSVETVEVVESLPALGI